MSGRHAPPDADAMPWRAHYPPGVAWDAPLPQRPAFALLDDTAAAFAARPGFDFLGKKWSWGAIGDLVNRFAQGLQEAGVSKGVKVGLFLPNCPYFLIAWYAILKAGGTVVNFNPLYAPMEIQHQIEDSETDIMVTLDMEALYGKLAPMLDASRLEKIVVCSFAAALPFPQNILFRLFKGAEIARIAEAETRCLSFSTLIRNPGTPRPVAVDPARDVAVLQYTGGTTGVPKGAMLTHANVTSNVEQALLWFHRAQCGMERMMGVLPFFHVFAMTAVMNLSVRCAFEIIALPRFDLDRTLKVISRKKPHYFPAVPAIYSAINAHPQRAKYDLRSLRYCISGGAPLPMEVKRSFEENTGCVVVEGYGLSETSPIVCVNPIDGPNKPGSIGQPLPGTAVRLTDPATGRPVTASGAKGELCVRGPQVMKGYYNRPGETANVLSGGWLRTGDIAAMDAEGYFYIVDRIKDLIITNGYNVYPRQVEEAIHLHPGVEECIVAGIPDRARGEVVKAWVKPRDGCALTAEDLQAFLRDKLSRIEMPRQYEFRTAPLPKTMIGKLSRKDVLAQEKSGAAEE